MAFNLLNADSTAQWVTNTAGDTYVVAQGVYLGVLGTAISGTAAVTNRKFQIDGHVIGEGSGSGMFIGFDATSGGFNTIHIAATGSILGEAYGIASLGGGLELVNNGDVSGSTAGLSMTGDLNHVINAGSISSWNGSGLISAGVDADIVNQGAISGVANGVELNGDSFHFVNSGLLTSSTGVLIEAAVYMTGHYGWFVNEGTISCLNSYSMLGDVNAQEVTNRGFISSTANLGGGNDTFTNEGGTVHGQIQLGAGYDTFKLIGGTVTDKVFGGDDSDFYIIDSAAIQLVEFADEGYDGVRSSVSYRLEVNFEDLELSGQADLVGKGNALANQIAGNSGDNRLFGFGGADLFESDGGADVINGGTGVDTVSYENSASGVVASLGSAKGKGGDADGDRYVAIENLTGSDYKDSLIGNAGANRLKGYGGTDVLTGGGGKDTFVFVDGDDRETVTDFKDGEDLIDFTFIYNGTDIDTFAELKPFIQQKGADVVMDFSSLLAGQVLTLHNVDKSDLTAADFVFS